MDTPSSPEASDGGQHQDEATRRIADLLAEGQAAFERKEYQVAIDAWSRIYLIDFDHPDAGRLIETARRLQAEQARQIEEMFHEAVARIEGGDTEAARDGLSRVLAYQPNHQGAREQLRRLDLEPAAAAVAEDGDDGTRVDADTEPGVVAPVDLPLRPAPPRPRERGARPATDSSTPQPAYLGAASRRNIWRRHAVLWIAGGVSILTLLLLSTLYGQRHRFFPNLQRGAYNTDLAVPSSLITAQRLHAAGRIGQAVAILERLQPDHPDYAEARNLLAQWQGSLPNDADDAEQRRSILLEEARQRLADDDPLAAHRALTEAETIGPLAGEDVSLRERIDGRLAPVAEALKLYREGSWEYAMPHLWRVRDASPGDPVSRRLLIDGYYNLAVRSLQQNMPGDALQRLDEAAELEAEDPQLDRIADFARAYEGQPLDLRYRLFVKYLPYR